MQGDPVSGGFNPLSGLALHSLESSQLLASCSWTVSLFYSIFRSSSIDAQVVEQLNSNLQDKPDNLGWSLNP